MSSSENKLPATVTDLLGIQAVGETFKDTVADARAFLGLICKPAAQELGLLFQDHIKEWRANNALQATKRAAVRYQKMGLINEFAPPRLIHYALEEASWTDDDLMTEMWVGLMVSSCTKTGRDDSNLHFMRMLSSITASQAKIIEYSCLNAKKYITIAGWLCPEDEEELLISLEDLQKITGVDDFHRLDIELDHLRSIEFLPTLSGGFGMKSTTADITPTPFDISFYARCQGFLGTPAEFFGLKLNN